MTIPIYQRAAVFTVALSATMAAGSLTDLRRACLDRANLHNGKYWTEECAEQLLTANPVRLTVGTIAPGTGPGFGLSFNHDPFRPRSFEIIPNGTAVVSTDGSFLLQSQLTIAFPAPHIGTIKTETGAEGHQHDVRTIGLIRDTLGIDPKASVTVRAKRFEATPQDFYGLGATTSLSGLTVYGLRQNEAGVAFNYPMSSWIAIGATTDFIQPRVMPVAGTATQIDALYNATTAPGLNSRDDFLRVEPYLQFRVPVHGSSFADTKIGYEFYHDLGGHRYTFGRLSVISIANYTMYLPSSGNPPQKRHVVTNFICPVVRSFDRCSPGELTFNGILNIAYTRPGSSVPFYFGETLGGADIDGNDTLRGFVDYRFRGPSRVLFQAEYRHALLGPVGLLAFFDIGKVGVLPSDLTLENLRHDTGLGLYFQAAHKVLVRAYIAFGSGEGLRPNYKLPAF